MNPMVSVPDGTPLRASGSRDDRDIPGWHGSLRAECIQYPATRSRGCGGGGPTCLRGPMTKRDYVVFLVHSTNHALRAEKILAAAGIDSKLIPVPREFSSDCVVCVRVRAGH